MAMRNVFRRNISWPHWTYAIKTGKLDYFYNSKGFGSTYLIPCFLLIFLPLLLSDYFSLSLSLQGRGLMQKNISSDYTGMIGVIFTFTFRCPF
jgi:hypothetical protein